MTDLFKLGMKLLKEIPDAELQEKFSGITGVHATLVFANRIKGELTQEQLAEKSKVDVTTIHRIEGGQKDVSNTDLEKVFAILEITSEDIKEAMKDRERLLKEIKPNQNEKNRSKNE